MGKFEGESHASGGLKEEASDEQIYDIILAPFWKRLIAWIIDQILLGAVITLLFYLVTGKAQVSLEINPTMVYITQIFLLANLAYFTALEGFTSQTLGKRIMGISVYGETGGKVSFTSALFRRIGLVVPFFPLLDGGAILLSSKNQRIFDMIAGTLVVEADYEREASLFLEGKDVSGSLKRKGALREPDFEKDKEKKILDKLKKMRFDLKEQYENGEIEEDRYENLKRRYESRINQLEKEIGNKR